MPRYKASGDSLRTQNSKSDGSMSPMRADVKEKFFPLSLRREMDCIQPDLRSGEALGSRRARDRPSQSADSTRRFHDAMVRRLRFRKLRKQTGWLYKSANHGPI